MALRHFAVLQAVPGARLLGHTWNLCPRGLARRLCCPPALMEWLDHFCVRARRLSVSPDSAHAFDPLLHQDHKQEALAAGSGVPKGA